MPRARKQRNIPSEWFGLAPSEDMEFWIGVHTVVKRRGVRMRDLEKVNKVINELKGKEK